MMRGGRGGWIEVMREKGDGWGKGDVRGWGDKGDVRRERWVDRGDERRGIWVVMVE